MTIKTKTRETIREQKKTGYLFIHYNSSAGDNLENRDWDTEEEDGELKKQFIQKRVVLKGLKEIP